MPDAVLTGGCLCGSRGLAVFAVVVTAALAAAGCGSKNVIIPSGAEKTITHFIATKTPATAHDVSCPEDVEAKVGNTFDCSFTDEQGTKYTAHMRITKVEGSRVLFHINSELAK